MAIVFLLLFLASIILLIIGLKNPQKALFWKKNEQVTRKQVTVFYTWAIIITLFAFVAAIPDKSKEEKAKAAESESELQYQLARSCDTNWRFINNPEKCLHQKGFFVDFSDVRTEGSDWYKKPWAASTYKQIGPEAFEIDQTKKLAVFEPVEVQSSSYGRFRDFDHYFLIVSPVGSTETYIIDENDFTLKDVKSCSLLQRAKNEFYTLAEYIPPADENNRPVDESNRSWIDVPAGARILVKKYYETNNTIFGEIYRPDGEIVSLYARFRPETLKEVSVE